MDREDRGEGRQKEAKKRMRRHKAAGLLGFDPVLGRAFGVEIDVGHGEFSLAKPVSQALSLTAETLPGTCANGDVCD
jgi:hypothetical protein